MKRLSNKLELPKLLKPLKNYDTPPPSTYLPPPSSPPPAPSPPPPADSCCPTQTRSETLNFDL